MEHLRDKPLSPATPHLYIMASLSGVGKALDLCTVSPTPAPDTPPFLCSQLQHSGLKLCPWTGASSYLFQTWVAVEVVGGRLAPHQEDWGLQLEGRNAGLFW